MQEVIIPLHSIIISVLIIVKGVDRILQAPDRYVEKLCCTMMPITAAEDWIISRFRMRELLPMYEVNTTVCVVLDVVMEVLRQEIVLLVVQSWCTMMLIMPREHQVMFSRRLLQVKIWVNPK